MNRLNHISKVANINKITLKLGGLIMMLSYLPQIFQVIQTRSSDGINILFIIMVTLALASFTFNGYVIWKKTGMKDTMISQLANFIPAIILLVLIIIFR